MKTDKEGSNVKKLLALLMAALMLCAPALAESGAEMLAPFALATPPGVTVQVNDASLIYVAENGSTRVVAMVIDRVPDPEGDHAAALMTLMAQFAPDAEVGEALLLTPGFYGLSAVTPAALEGASGEMVEQLTVMVLRQTALEGQLLILSGYDLSGDAAAVQALIDLLLNAVTVNDAPILPLPALPGAQG